LAEVVVVGADLGGLATAARLAKLGHSVTVVERGDAPGGLLAQVEHAGFTWDATPFSTTIPAVLRDLFRKSGRPLERYLDLELSTPARRHVFADGTTLDLPTGSRGGQLDAVTETLGSAAGEAWTRFVDGRADLWTTVRSSLLDPPDGVSRLSDRRLSRTLGAKQSLDSLLGKAFDDVRLRDLASYPVQGNARSHPSMPGFSSVSPYVERLFGVWRAPGGAADLARALIQRMAERSVDVRLGNEVTSLRVTTDRANGDRVDGVELAAGAPLRADLVVTSVSPRQVFGRLLDHRVRRAAVPLFATGEPAGPTVSYLALTAQAPALPAEVVLHGDPLVTIHSNRPSAEAPARWTLVTRAASPVDVLDTIAARGIDVRSHLINRLDSSPRPAPVPWTGRRDAAARAAFAHPLPGLHCLGTALVLGGSVPYVAWQAAHVAERLGKA
jgi:phytoene dehydrogenase-like protein